MTLSALGPCAALTSSASLVRAGDPRGLRSASRSRAISNVSRRIVPVSIAPPGARGRTAVPRAAAFSRGRTDDNDRFDGSRPSRTARPGGRVFPFFLRRRTPMSAVAAAANNNDNDAAGPRFGGAPVEPGTGHGQMLAHVLSSEPHLFTAALEATLDRMSDDLDRDEGVGSIDVGEGGKGEAADDSGLVLFKRIKEMRAVERRNSVQDLMYASILQKFLNIGVDMLPPLDDEAMYLRGVDLNQLTNGVHSTEALAMVKEHLLGMLGPTGNGYSNSLVRMSKLQAAQMYAASIMFGYFLRKADKRFSLDRAMGTLPKTPMESAEALEALFNSASAMDSMDEADPANFNEKTYDVDGEGNAQASQDADGGGTSTLKQYIQSFDQQTLAETARIVSLEGVLLAERQTGALFGAVEDLAREMQKALEEGGEPISTPEELMSRVNDAVGSGKVKTVTVNIATQRRVVLEAVAFGSFLRDAESYVDTHDQRLLTPAPRGGQGPPGMIGSGA